MKNKIIRKLILGIGCLMLTLTISPMLNHNSISPMKNKIHHS
jgi:hypothetical protein